MRTDECKVGATVYHRGVPVVIEALRGKQVMVRYANGETGLFWPLELSAQQEYVRPPSAPGAVEGGDGG